MLLRRVITALCLAAAALAGIFLLPTWGFALLFGLAAGAGVYEWSGFLQNATAAARFGYVLLYAVLIALIYQNAWVVLLCGGSCGDRMVWPDSACAGLSTRPSSIYALMAGCCCRTIAYGWRLGELGDDPRDALR